MVKSKGFYYEVYKNGVYLYIDNFDINNLRLRKIGQGEEANVYYFNRDILFKIYKKGIIEGNENIYNEDRINEIAARRKLIIKSKLLYGPIYINGEFAGCTVYNHRYAPRFIIIKMIPSNNYALDRFVEVIDAIRELEINDMYHMDLRPENILIPKFKKSELIDLDGKSMILSDKDNSEYSKKMYNNLFNLMLKLLFDFFYKDCSNHDKYIDEAFKYYKIDKSFISEFYKENFDYEILYDFLSYLKTDKVLDKRLILK